jgi:hypothetical protein
MLDEPCYNDAFCLRIWAVIWDYGQSYLNFRKSVFGDDNSLANNRKLLEKDVVFFELFRTKFPVMSKGKVEKRDLTVVGELLPINHMQEFWKQLSNEDRSRRTFSNGMVKRLCNLLCKNEFSLFMKGDEKDMDSIDWNWNVPGLPKGVSEAFLEYMKILDDFDDLARPGGVHGRATETLTRLTKTSDRLAHMQTRDSQKENVGLKRYSDFEPPDILG